MSGSPSPRDFIIALMKTGGSSVGRSLSYIPSYATSGSLPYLRYTNTAMIGLKRERSPSAMNDIAHMALDCMLSSRFFSIMALPFLSTCFAYGASLSKSLKGMRRSSS